MKKLGRFGATCFGNRVKKIHGIFIDMGKFQDNVREKDI